ncbi:MAG: hypothetical protein JST66_13755 [Bacteroidetes bacterium]|nr:hypothetical protein [Bacteroidota bacterium]
MERVLLLLALLSGTKACGPCRSLCEARTDMHRTATGGHGRPEASPPSRMARYPGKDDGILTVQVDRRSTRVTITVLDPAGNFLLRKRACPAANGWVWMDLSHLLAPGAYFVRCDDGLTITGHRLVVP